MSAAARVHELEHAVGDIAPLEPWEDLPAASIAAFTRGPGLVRVRRMLDYVEAGDRVLDVGSGFGYPAGVLLRDTAVDHCCGIDLHERLARSCARMAEANGFDPGRWSFEVRDVYDVTEGFVAELGANLVLLMAVLEHLPDPDLALHTLAAAMSPAASLLFTVPLPGRFDETRELRLPSDGDGITTMCAHAGLTVHHVEPWHDTWVAVLASRDPAPPARLTALPGRAAVR